MGAKTKNFITSKDKIRKIDSEKQGLSAIEEQKFSSMVNLANAMNNKANFSNVMKQMGLSESQMQEINSLSGIAKANAFARHTTTAQFSGTVNGRSFNLRMGSDIVAWNGTIDSSVNVRGGYNVDMGSALGATGWASGGVAGMRAMGIAKTTYDRVMGVVDLASDFIPSGKAFKKASSIMNAVKGMKGGKGGAKGDEGTTGKENIV